MATTSLLRELSINGRSYRYYNLRQISDIGLGHLERLPFSIRILVENLLRRHDGIVVRDRDLHAIAGWRKRYDNPVEIPYHPARVLMQDFTGVPAVVDLAAMRDAVRDLGGDPGRVNPQVPVELIVDHSIQIDHFGTSDSLRHNVAKEYERNGERYALLKWAQRNFSNFKVVPPNSGICHQVNLEYLGRVVIVAEREDGAFLYPDTVVGLDSHTPMINGIGVMAWGVGGIEAEAVMLGQPYSMSIPEVIGVRLLGRPRQGITATDIVLTLTERLRQYRVVEKFVEFFGPGLASLSIPDRATIANMTPEFGATLGFFPIDDRTIEYLRLTNRHGQAEITAAYAREVGLYYLGADSERVYTDILDFDLAAVTPCLAGPARPQDRIPLAEVKRKFAGILGCKYQKELRPQEISTFHQESGCSDPPNDACFAINRREFSCDIEGLPTRIGDGSVVIAAITSCTNTSNPHVLIGAGLLARNAVRSGLKVPRHVKTSFAPGSKVVTNYLDAAGLTPYLEALGFHLAAFGCTTCIGNSGPLHPEIDRLIEEHGLNVAAVLSGNRNFEARIHQRVKSNFLTSPLLVIAFALAGRIDIDPDTEPVGCDPNGKPVFLGQLWPAESEIEQLIAAHVTSEAYAHEYRHIFQGDEFWDMLPANEGTTYAWLPESTYIRRPPYFDGLPMQPPPIDDISGARVLLRLGDMVTTDHISPAGAIARDYPAGVYLTEHGVPPAQFNSYGSRRGNHEVMMRGTFANIRIRNLLTPSGEGSYTRKLPGDALVFVHEAAMQYQAEGVPLLVLAGREYGAGSSRDWAAKGPYLLGIRVVIAESYERIHRNNLVGMGVLPLVFREGENCASLGLKGTETFSFSGLAVLTPRGEVPVVATNDDGSTITFTTICRLDTEIDVLYFRHGGILPYVLRRLMQS
ncbi:MAG: aconitate hydratase AcnA [Desulfobulbaceae bacterium]|nr:MAG: aconitate hydratase AcnA [Desulfobulbaceae bacterium]